MTAERISASSARQYGQDTATITLPDSISTRGTSRPGEDVRVLKQSVKKLSPPHRGRISTRQYRITHLEAGGAPVTTLPA
jgi:hypothetical protein